MTTSLAAAISALESEGYVEDLRARNDRLANERLGRTYDPRELQVDRVVRMEVLADPDDQAVIFAVSAPDGTKALYITPFGTTLDGVDADVIGRLGVTTE